MSVYYSRYAQEDLPNIVYAGIPREMVKWVLRAAPRLAGYEVTFIPIDTPEKALAAAQERAAHLQAEGETDAWEQGAVFVVSSGRQSTPEEYAEKLHTERASKLFMKVRMPPGASSYELLREYYDARLGPETTRD